MEKVTLHRCPLMFVKMQGHACWRVQSALDDQGIPYEVVKAPVLKGKRETVQRLSHQRLLPVIEFADGTAYREESKDMAARIRAGKLFEGRQAD
jgi:glutathione S-transferase